MKYELQDILSGKSQISQGVSLQSIIRYLGVCAEASKISKQEKHFKKEEAKSLEKYIVTHNLWFENIDFSQYVSEGAEQKVYLKDSSHVLKLNDAIYYISWEDYFHNLLLHNYFFPDTSYELLGFTKQASVLYAVVKQAFVSSTEQTDLNKVRTFLEANGFKNIRNNDYYNPELGIILEDLHDENVLTQKGILFFIDTVFYLTENFWKNDERHP